MNTTGVCLITPPSPFLLDERVFPFIGVLMVAASLRQRGHAIEALDLSGYTNFPDIVKEHVSRSRMEVFGITATTPQIPATIQIVDAIRTVRPSAKIILGGPHATFVHAALKREKNERRLGRAQRAFKKLEETFDVIVAGDGEEAIFEALEDSAPKVVDADDRHFPLWQTGEKLTHKPYPARDLLDMESYRYFIDGERATHLIAQLGCPFECGFCAGRHSPMARHIRIPTIGRAVGEMVHLYKTYGIRGFMFYDDELNLVQDRVLALMEEITRTQRELGVEWFLRGYVKAELFNDEQAKAMHEAGFRVLMTGFESGSERILENIKKKATQADNTRAMDIARRHGLKVKAAMSLGHPGESSETANDTRKWLLDVRPFEFDVSIITPYPGSPYFDDAKPGEKEGEWTYTAKNGDRLHQVEIDYTQEADYYKGNPDDGYVSHVYTDALSRKDLIRERDFIERDVRKKLGIPFNPSTASINYEHSMGAGPVLPPRILRTSMPTATSSA